MLLQCKLTYNYIKQTKVKLNKIWGEKPGYQMWLISRHHHECCICRLATIVLKISYANSLSRWHEQNPELTAAHLKCKGTPSHIQDYIIYWQQTMFVTKKFLVHLDLKSMMRELPESRASSCCLLYYTDYKTGFDPCTFTMTLSEQYSPMKNRKQT